MRDDLRRIGIIDIGSNSIRLVIYDTTPEEAIRSSRSVSTLRVLVRRLRRKVDWSRRIWRRSSQSCTSLRRSAMLLM